MRTKTFECKTCKNENCLIQKHSKSQAIQVLLTHKNSFTCQEGQQFILEGAPVSGLYFIYDGCVKVFKQTANNDAQIIRFSKNGEIVGHRGFATDYVYGIGSIALVNTNLCHFPTNILIKMLHAVPALMFDFMLFYADQLQKSEANAKRFSQMSVREKVINGLLFIEQKFGQTDGLINIILSRKDIADFAGTTTDQVIRVISALKKENRLISKGKMLGIVNVAQFEAELNNVQFFLEG